MNNRHQHPPSQHIEETEETRQIEEQLRRAAPSLRPQLRASILLRCQPAAPNARPAPRISGPGARVKWSLAGACALCVLQWLVVSHLDARSEAAIHGRPTSTLWARATLRGGSARAESDWPRALQRRALLLSALMNNSDSAALWPSSPAAQSS